VEKNQGDYWDTVNAGWAHAAARLGLAVRVTAPEYEDLDEQLALMREHLESGVDVLAFVATDPDAFGPIVAEAQAAGVIVLTFDLDAPACGRTLFVGMQPGVEMGRAAGRLMLEHVRSGQKVLAQTGSTAAQGAVGKLRGFVETVSAAGVEVVVAESDGENLERAARIAEALLAQHPDAAGMYGVYGYHPAIQARAAEAAGRPGVAVIGFDMVPDTVAELQRGTVRASIWIRDYYFGYLAGVAAHDLAVLGGDEVLALYGMDPARPETTARLLPITAYTPQNVHEYVSWSEARLNRQR